MISNAPKNVFVLLTADIALHVLFPKASLLKFAIKYVMISVL